MTSFRPALTRICIASGLFLMTSSGFELAQAAGALAVGSCGAYGLSYDFKESTAASAAALKQCSGDCQVATAMNRNCAALAIDVHNACGSYGYAAAPQLAQAQNTALQNCYRYGGKDCVIRAFVCDLKN
jgi:hypothetical protein